MNRVIEAAKRFVRDEEGVTAIEYGLLAALIGVAIIVAVRAMGGELITLFGKVSAALKNG